MMGDDRKVIHTDIDAGAILSNAIERRFPPFLNKFYQILFSVKPHSGVSVVEEDWDVLVVLDACRHDFFEELNNLDGELSKRTSLGASSEEWLNDNFTGFYEDIVYLSANPYVTPTDDGGFRSDEHFPSKQVYSLILDDDVQENGVVIPEKLTERAISKSRELGGDERMIVHYMQPHIPYIGKPAYPEGTVAEVAEEVGDERLKELYRANLERVLESVRELKQNISGKIVVTADHGEMLGEYGIYGHYPGIYFDELVEVPWLETQGEKEKEISDIDF
jgi:hypothetical protein